MNKHILIVTDAWEPQINGVVRTLQTTIKHLREQNYNVTVIEPSMFKTVSLPGYSEIKLAYDLKLLPIAMFADGIPDYIHIAVEGPLGIAARKVCMDQGLQFTTAYHTKFPEYLWEKYCIPSWVGHQYARWFHRPSSKMMVATSSLTRELYTKRYQNNFAKWSRGVDTELFHPKWRDPMFSEPYVLYVGRISHEKNIEAFLKADTGFRTKVVVGDGPQKAKLKAKYPQVVFAGAHTGEQLAKFYANADVFVFPSKTDTFGLVMIEALASGTPVVAYNVSSPKDIIVNGHSGILSRKEDLSLSIQMATIIDRKICRREAEAYTWENATKQFVSNLVPVV